MRWTDYSKDPNSPEALRFRATALALARRPPIPDRIDYLKSWAAGKRVLDIGVVDHFLESRAATQWLHGQLAEVAKSSLGIDVLKSEVERLQDEGYAVEHRDITLNPPNGTFDVIIAGEIIEHLGNPGSLFEAASQLLAPAGHLILTTPNPYELGRLWHALRGRSVESTDHVVMLFPSAVAELAERVGLRLDRFCGVRRKRRQPTVRGRWARRTKELLARCLGNPEAACPTIIYHCKREP